MSVSWTVDNAGDATASGPWRDNVYFSGDAVLDLGDTNLLFVDKAADFTLDAGNDYTEPQNVALPNVAAGTYYLIVETDGDNDVTEADEANNTFSTAIQVTTCGDGTVGGVEECDQGGANGNTSCCTTGCLIRAAGQTCRPSAGDCDVVETCDGSSPVCPADAFEPGSTVCRSAAGECDVAESCPGNGPACPADDVVDAGIECRAAAGDCDIAESCDGVSTDCPTDLFEPASTVCRSAAGDCDVAESCPGTGPACPADDVVDAGIECRATAGDCDVAESCDGVSTDCPTDLFEPASTVCRSATGDCDVAESCPGNGAACPANDFVNAGVECRAMAGDCDIAESCDGVSADCPPDVFEPASTVCRNATGNCDVAESCPGTGPACPANDFVDAGTECRAPAGICDAAESCTGASATCPADTKLAAGTDCRASVGRCDATEECDGSSDDCPPDVREPNGTVCRDDEGICDVAETCDGVSTVCPPDGFEPEGTTCDDGITCTVNDQCVAGVCQGDSMTCSDGNVQASCNEDCDDGNTTNDDGCDDSCHFEPCKPTHDLTCTVPFVPGKASIKLKHDPAKEDKNSVLWKWSKGSFTDKLEFGDPLANDDYWLCIYDNDVLVSTTRVAPGGTCDGADCWSEKSSGFQFKSKTPSAEGATGISLLAGDDGKSKAQFKGKGAGLGLPEIGSVTGPLVVQLLNATSGACWSATYSAPFKKVDEVSIGDRAD